MNNCPVCKTGELIPSGSHLYCSNCQFTLFHMTAYYIEASAVLMGTLISNTTFVDDEALGRVIARYMFEHLPQLHRFVGDIKNGMDEFMSTFIDNAKSQAINVVVGNTVTNEEPQNKKLKCKCGSDDFKRADTVADIWCVDCEAQYVFNQQTGLWEPYFLCQCGNVTYSIDEHYSITGMVFCSDCEIVYLHDSVNHIFRKVVTE